MLKHFTYIAAELYFWLKKKTPLFAAVLSEIVTSVRKFRIYGKYARANGIPPPLSIGENIHLQAYLYHPYLL